MPEFQSYRIYSNRTWYYVISNGNEKDGDIVETALGSSTNAPEHSVVSISPPVAKITLGFIKGKAGLYIGRPDNASEGTRLIWTSKADNSTSQWEFTCDASGFYEIFIPGNDSYWFDRYTIPRVVELLPGSKTTEGENLWNIKSA